MAIREITDRTRRNWRLVGLLLSTWCCFALASQGEEVQIPADLVRQLFDQRGQNHAIKKRPFSLAELETLTRDYGSLAPTADELTRRYLQITYAAGTVDYGAVERADLPESSKLLLFRAPPGSLRITFGREAMATLDQIPSAHWQALWETPQANLDFDASLPDDIATILTLNQARYSQASFYATQVPVQTATTNYSVSYPVRESHRLGTYLQKSAQRERSINFLSSKCEGETCISQPVGESFASFRFLGSDARYPKAGQRVEARCRYQATYRRDYFDRFEIEFAFESCRLEKLEGAALRRDPLLEDLQKVKLP